VSRIPLTITLTGFFLLSVPLRAQSISTRLDGTVFDTSGNPIQGATVTATDESMGWSTQVTSDAEGHYVFPALRAAVYTVAAQADRFKGVIRRQVSLVRPNNVTENFVLQPGNPTEADEEVEAHEPLPQTDAQIAGSFARRELDALPLITRDPLSLAVYQPGVQIAGGNEAASTVNGNRQGSNVVAMDGVSVSDPVNPRLGTSVISTNPDAIREVRIVTDGAKAEYGQYAGGQVMLMTRSGTNAWHGSVFDYFRSKMLTAGDFFTNSQSFIDVNNGPLDQAKPHFQQNIYGGTLSGPISQNKTFVFGNYEGRYTTQQQLINNFVLTPLAKAGIFQYYTPGTTTLQSYDIVSNDPRKLGIDPTVKSNLAKLPDPNNTTIGDRLNVEGYVFNSPANSNDNQATVRIDHALTATQH